MKKKNILIFAITLLVSTPLYLYAATNSTPTCSDSDMSDVKNILVSVSCLLNNYVIPLLFTLAVVAFIWGIITFYLNPENEEKRKKGKSFIVGGLIALFVMTSIWGIINVFRNTLGTNNVPDPTQKDLPKIDIQ